MSPYTALAGAALRDGEAFLALDIAQEGSAVLGAMLRRPVSRESEARAVQRALSHLGHIEALALARTGSTATAQERLGRLYAQDKDNPEIAGALARTFKDFAMEAGRGADTRRAHLERAHRLYLDGYRRSRPRSAFLGINAAATTLWLGARADAAALARELEDLCRAELTARPGDYWALATLAEASLLQGETARAIECYAQARAAVEATRHWADLSTTRRQARRHCEHLDIDPAPIESALCFPRLAVFSGHMIDGPARPAPRFPDDPALLARVAADIGRWLERERIGFALCAAACGADLLFIEELRKRGAEVHVVMPWREADFIASSVLPGGERWVREYERLREHFCSVTCLTQETLPSEQGLGFEYCNCCINGIALQRARVLDAEVRPLAVWDGKPGDGPGGTASFVGFWHRHGVEPEIISLPARTAASGGTASHPDRPSRLAYQEIKVSRGQQSIKTLLFADVVGYSKISETQTEQFAPQFLGAISELIAHSGLRQPIHSNTWGDALYLVFDEATDAGIFALRLRAMIQTTRWAERGLPPGLNVRIALHTGPVLLCVDPVIRQITFTGRHVNHAARIEPMVEAGEIFATEAFVAFVEIARSHGETIGFHADYLGQVDFAKSYGRYPLFRLRAETVGTETG